MNEDFEDSIGDHSSLAAMEDQMLKEGKSKETIHKYLRDAKRYLEYASGDSSSEGCYDANVLAGYREYLYDNYAVTSVNSMIAGINYYFKISGHNDLKIRTYRYKRDVFRNDERVLSLDEYKRLLRSADKRSDKRLSMIIQTLGSTGIRVSELPFITVESLEEGKAMVLLKGRSRAVLMPALLCERLKAYADENGVSSGSIFVTRSGKPVDRSNILHDMKSICTDAGVNPSKVFPHNLRHLFAVTYYKEEKDICRLADILGHSSINTTRIYTTTGQTELKRTIESLGLL